MSAPFYSKPTTVSTVMGKVLLALLPGIAVSTWYFGAAVLIQIALATVTALLAEGVLLRLRGLPAAPFLKDGSAVLTAWLLALSIPPLSAWWLTVVITLLAIVVAKQLYGGLGNNPFNPAMVGVAAAIISFPKEMAARTALHDPLSSLEQLVYIFTRELPARLHWDALNSATPLDLLKTQLMLGQHDVNAILQMPPYGYLSGAGYEWIALAFVLGGLWLWQQRIIPWQTPLACLAGLCLIALPLWLINPAQYANPLFHLLGGATMLGAWFIVTDPVTSPTTGRGQLIFGLLTGILLYLIRVFGGFPDAVAFAVLIMNIAVPLIDQLTQPPVFGQGKTS